ESQNNKIEQVTHKSEQSPNSEITSDAKLLGLKLQERDDTQDLENAIREAELLLHQGKLPDVLVDTLTEARQYFDATRNLASQALTMARTGTVCESWWGVQ